jgi:peptidoglycan/xylan/chitin deacetylase (PgdA/CDA1 family)
MASQWSFIRFVRIFSLLALMGTMAVIGSCTHTQPVGRTVAITFDDLPLVNPKNHPQALQVAEQTNQKILAALSRHRAPATGFVNEVLVRDIGPGADRLLMPWNRGRYELASHGANHADANGLDLPALEREIIDGETTIGPMARKRGRSLRFFRFPFNHLGDTQEKQDGVMALLKARGYQLAASTIDTSDYVFAHAFERALNENDVAMQNRIKQAYLDHTETQIAYYAGLNRQVLGYEPPAIMLLHINRLNGETMDGQLALFRKAGYRFVSLAQAQSDPAYAQPPRLATRFGPMWGYRWARDRGVRVNGRLEVEPPQWIGDYGANKPVSAPPIAAP